MITRSATITVDIESDWGGRMPAESSFFQGVDEGIPKILRVLNKHRCSATFFISASVAEKRKGLAPSLASYGHEVASHGYAHNINYASLTGREHLYQLEKSKNILEAQLGKKIYGFRSPQFRAHPDIFLNLQKAGYHYDSSFFAERILLKRKSYFGGDPRLASGKYGIDEIPVSSIPLIGIPLGLLWANMLGHDITIFLLKYVNPNNRHYVMYGHGFDMIFRKRYVPHIPYSLKYWHSWKSYKAEDTLDALIGFLKAQREIKTLQETYFAQRNT